MAIAIVCGFDASLEGEAVEISSPMEIWGTISFAGRVQKFEHVYELSSTEPKTLYCSTFPSTTRHFRPDNKFGENPQKGTSYVFSAKIKGRSISFKMIWNVP